MQSEDQRSIRRLEELEYQSRSFRSYTFSDFLTPMEASLACETADSRSLRLWGGYESAERVVARFGNAGELGYEEEFPIRILRIAPGNEKFAEELGHRDYLGSLISLGIERSVLGDILVDGKTAYVFVLDRMAEFVKDALVKVRHTRVSAEEVETLPDSAGPTLERRELVVSSPRLDGVISKLYGFSRSEAKAVFAKQEVFRNGRLCMNASAALEEGDLVSVRHHGRFIFRGGLRQTKKGKERVAVEVYT